MGPVLLDANVFVSASISPKGAPNLIATAWARNEFEDMVLAVALGANAQYIVTGDRPLLSLGEYSGIRILSPGDFYAILKKQVKV